MSSMLNFKESPDARLATMLRPSLDLPSEKSGLDAPLLDDDLALNAVKRHRIGGLLHKAVANSDVIASENTKILLAKSYRKNTSKKMRQTAVLLNLTKLLLDADIRFWPIKGTGLAQQLYSDINAHISIDIDILIDASETERVIKIFHDAGYKPIKKGKVFAPSLKREALRMLWYKDEAYRDEKFGEMIELHRRVNYYEPFGMAAKLSKEWMVSKAPSIQSDTYLFYLLFHGASDRWARMKWLADMSLALRELSEGRLLNLLKIAKEFDCQHAILASIYWVEQVFPDSVPSETYIALENRIMGDKKASKLMRSFARNLMLKNHVPKYFMPRYFPTPAWDIFSGLGHKLRLLAYVPIAAIIRRI